MTDPKAAREALGVRLRDIRLDAGYSTARDLAAALGFSPQKVGRIEGGQQSIKEADLRKWAVLCHAGDQVPELIAARREVGRMLREHKREMRAGLVHIQSQGTDEYAATSLLRVYESTAIPGVLMTEDFAATSMEASARLHGRPLGEARPAARAKMARQEVLLAQTGRNRYHFVLEAGALCFGYGGPEVMRAQLDFLIEVTRMPFVSLGIIPHRTDRTVLSKECFYIFDERVVTGDTWLAVVETSRKDQITYYLKAFDLLRQLAVYGDEARALIEEARLRLG